VTGEQIMAPLPEHRMDLLQSSHQRQWISSAL
jgi:hypothetical protein